MKGIIQWHTQDVKAKSWLSRLVVSTLLFLLVYVITHLAIPGQLAQGIADDHKGFLLTQKVQYNGLEDSLKVLKAEDYRKLISNYLGHTAMDQSVKEEIFFSFFIIELPQDFDDYLSAIEYESDSFFWLSNECAYLEVIFWSLFGVFCSLLYHGTEAIRMGKFDESEMPVHIAKLVYSPLVTLIVVFSVNVGINSGDIVLDDISYWTVVFAFILGFYSRKAIDLLDRIKDIIFRNAESKSTAPVEGAEPDLSTLLQSNLPKLKQLSNFQEAYLGSDVLDGNPTPCIMVEISDSDEEAVKRVWQGDYSRVLVMKDSDVPSATIGVADAIAHVKYPNYQGTVGCPVQAHDGSLYLITCAHVVTGGPFIYVNGPLATPTEVVDAQRNKIGHFTFGYQTTHFDLGVVKLTDSTTIQPSGYHPDPLPIEELELGQKLHFKGLVNTNAGYVVAKGRPAHILFGSKLIELRNLIKVAKSTNGNYLPISSKGDSGAVLVNEQKMAVAMIVSSNSHFTFGFPLSPILNTLNLKLY